MGIDLCVVTNHWGWSARGIATWFRCACGKPFATWGVEVSGSVPRRFIRRVKIGPFAFTAGTYPPATDGPTKPETGVAR